MKYPATDGDGWTIFNLRHAHVSAEGFITWDVETAVERGAHGKAADIVRYPTAWVNCGECGKRLEFVVTPGTKISLPWEIGGWRVDWFGEIGVRVFCPNEVIGS